MTEGFMNRKSVTIVFLLFTLSCYKETNPVTSFSSQYKDFAHGYWEAVGGDTKVTEGIGLIVYNWYAIDTKSKDDSVAVIWDNGWNCTKTNATMKVNVIEMTVRGISAKFIVKNNKEATAYFKSNTKIYKKDLEKFRDDPTVYCH